MAQRNARAMAAPPIDNPSQRRLARFLLDGGHHVDTAQTLVDAVRQYQAALSAGQAVFEVPLVDGAAALIFGPGVRAIVPKPKPTSVIES